MKNTRIKFRKKIEINHQLLDDLLENAVAGANGDIKNAIISMSYSFQDVYSICGEMKNFRLLNERSELKNKIIELETIIPSAPRACTYSRAFHT